MSNFTETTDHPAGSIRSKNFMSPALLDFPNSKISEENSSVNIKKIQPIPLKARITDFGNYFQLPGRRIHALDMPYQNKRIF